MRREMRYENRRKVRKPARKARAAATAGALLLAGLVAGWPASLWAADDDDICGCAGSPSLGDFDSADPDTWPEGAYLGTSYTHGDDDIVIPLEPHAGGVLVFKSFSLSDGKDVTFAPNEANDPVTLLVQGDLTIGHDSFIHMKGMDATHGSETIGPGQGGLGGPGGYTGGAGALAASGFGGDGTGGIGPGAGDGGVAGVDKASSTVPTQATWLGVPELRPLSGGSGGGGGWSITDHQGCAAGGGGGGGGALLIAANGTIAIGGSGIGAGGGTAGARYSSSCSSSGSGGSGGAIRLVAKTITGTGDIKASGGPGNHGDSGPAGGLGSIRIEGENSGYTGSTTPSASRSEGRSPLVSPLIPSVVIVAIDGNPPPASPQGFRGGIDLDVTAADQVLVKLQSTDVPSGTELLVKATPTAGGLPVVETRAIAPESCGLGGAAAGVCDTTVQIELLPGAYIVEARATFQVPSP